MRESVEDAEDELLPDDELPQELPPKCGALHPKTQGKRTCSILDFVFQPLTRPRREAHTSLTGKKALAACKRTKA